MRESCSLKNHRYAACIIIVLISISILACRDPQDFQPDDPYTEAPAPPDFIYPLPDTTVNGTVVSVYFSWNAVARAESYEIQYDTSLTWPSDWRQTATASPCYISVRRYAYTTVYYCRIRALSASWLEGHTEWSQTRKFFVKPEG
ncbi:MAG: hypothetical protein JSW02_00185 [candidate division WOR-3 bacterium]|nr:MAG: hypothetical protein JSW02_00185 [candidate division WOR-3 bacterium]